MTAHLIQKSDEAAALVLPDVPATAILFVAVIRHLRSTLTRTPFELSLQPTMPLTLVVVVSRRLGEADRVALIQPRVGIE